MNFRVHTQYAKGICNILYNILFKSMHRIDIILSLTEEQENKPLGLCISLHAKKAVPTLRMIWTRMREFFQVSSGSIIPFNLV